MFPILAGDGCGQKLFYSEKRGALNVDQAREAPVRDGEREGMVLPYKYSIPMRPLKENKCVPTRRKDSHSNANSRGGVVKSYGSKEREGNLLSWGYSTLGILFQPEAFFWLRNTLLILLGEITPSSNKQRGQGSGGVAYRRARRGEAQTDLI